MAGDTMRFRNPAGHAGLLHNLVALLGTLAGFLESRAALFAKESKIELRKVVWPTSQETIQQTIIVVAVVVLTALFLWGIDSILLWGVRFFTGQRG